MRKLHLELELNTHVDKKIAEIIKWLDFMILNQEQLKMEWKDLPFPEWNMGYMHALNDMRQEVIKIDYPHKPMTSQAQEELHL